jgi:hypothetical protein
MTGSGVSAKPLTPEMTMKRKTYYIHFTSADFYQEDITRDIIDEKCSKLLRNAWAYDIRNARGSDGSIVFCEVRAFVKPVVGGFANYVVADFKTLVKHLKDSYSFDPLAAAAAR